MPISEIYPQKIKTLLPASAALLHDLGTMVAGQLTKAIIAVDDGPVYDLSVPQHKVCVCKESIEGCGGEAGERNQATVKKANCRSLW